MHFRNNLLGFAEIVVIFRCDWHLGEDFFTWYFWFLCLDCLLFFWSGCFYGAVLFLTRFGFIDALEFILNRIILFFRGGAIFHPWIVFFPCPIHLRFDCVVFAHQNRYRDSPYGQSEHQTPTNKEPNCWWLVWFRYDRKSATSRTGWDFARPDNGAFVPSLPKNRTARISFVRLKIVQLQRYDFLSDTNTGNLYDWKWGCVLPISVTIPHVKASVEFIGRSHGKRVRRIGAFFTLWQYA